MAEPKKIKTRVIQKHAQAAVWNDHEDFIPLEGELIVFDKDSSTSYPRLKIGDGSKTINELPFITAGTAEKLPHVTTTDDSFEVSITDDNNITELNIEKDNFTVSSTYSGGQGSYITADSNDIDIYTDTSNGSARILLSDTGAITANTNAYNPDGESPHAEFELKGEGLDIDFKSEYGYIGKLEADVDHMYFMQDSSSGSTNLDVGPYGISLTSSNTNSYSQNLDIGPGEAYIDLTDAQLQDHSRLELNFNGLNVQVEQEEVSLVDFKVGAHQVTHNGYKLLNTKDYITAGQKPDTALGEKATAEGSNTTASGNQAHAEGTMTQATAGNAHAEGRETIANAYEAHAEGIFSQATAQAAHAEGHHTLANGRYSHAEGTETQSLGDYSHAEGSQTVAEGVSAHSEGNYTKAIGNSSHASGYRTTASSDMQFVLGAMNANSEDNLFEVGNGKPYFDSGDDSDELIFNPTKSFNFNTFEITRDGVARAESFSTKSAIINRDYNLDEGKPGIILGAKAIGIQSVAFGGHSNENSVDETDTTKAIGKQSFAAGGSVIVNSAWGAGFGLGTWVTNYAEMAIGRYNDPVFGALFTVGNGSEDHDRKNALVVKEDGTLINKTVDAKAEIIDVITLPTQGDPLKFYRLMKGTLIEKQIRRTDCTCNIVEELPSLSTPTGHIIPQQSIISNEDLIQYSQTGVFPTAFNIYYKINDTQGIYAYVYVPAPLGQAFGLPADWYPLSAIEAYVPILAYRGTITEISDNDLTDGTFNILLEYPIYQYKNGAWTTNSVIGLPGAGNSAEIFNHPANIATGVASHAEGTMTRATGAHSHAEGKISEATGYASHAEGGNTHAQGTASHAEGEDTFATGHYSHAEGSNTTASGNKSHAEGSYSEAEGEYSHAGGHKTKAKEAASFAHGFWVNATEPYQAVFGKYNKEDADALFIVGKGESDSDRKNIFTVLADGTTKLTINNVITSKQIADLFK